MEYVIGKDPRFSCSNFFQVIPQVLYEWISLHVEVSNPAHLYESSPLPCMVDVCERAEGSILFILCVPDTVWFP